MSLTILNIQNLSDSFSFRNLLIQELAGNITKSVWYGRCFSDKTMLN